MTPRETWHLDTHHLGRRVFVFDRLDSTNTYAASLADDPANDGLVILAEEQTAGRGQYGRSWQCPARSGILMSLLLFPPPALRRPALLTAWAAVSVCETILSAVGLQAKIKWPNDVLLRGKKVCGILIEQSRGTIVGIGLNLYQSTEDFAAAGLLEAGSLAPSTSRALDWTETTRLLIRHLDEEYVRLCSGDLNTLEACWKWRLGLLGKQVLVESHTGAYQGRLRDLTWDVVEVELADAATVRLLPESIRHIHRTP